MYRLENVDEFYEIGGEEYFSNGICIIEWGEIIKEAIPYEHIEICFERDTIDINKRILNIKTFGERFNSMFDGGNK